MTTDERTDLAADLLAAIGDPHRVSTSESVLRTHGEPLMADMPPAFPDVVVFATSRDDVIAVLRCARERAVPVVAFGAGSSMEGEPLPIHGGISLDLSGLDTIEIRAADLQATVGAGVTRTALEAAAGEHGLWFPVDPGANATLGGMAATNASGTTTLRYGSMRQNVLGLEAVLASGEVIRTGSRTVKTSAGYDVGQLLIGSEGTLAIITAVTLRLYGIPEHLVAARAPFADIDAACRCAAALVGTGVSLIRCELVDAMTIETVNAHRGTHLPAREHLFLEFGGSREGVEGDLAAARAVAAEFGCTELEASSAWADRRELWAARHEALYALQHAHRGKALFGTDTCVPVSELPSAVARARTLVAEAGLHASIVGHAGDGNYHALIAVDPADADEVARAHAVRAAIVDDALARGGTCSGEHGIGVGKMRYLEREHGDLIGLMRGIKALLDPDGILNPGKIFSS
jgi:D-lactate dehydrogenase (cytochrome)